MKNWGRALRDGLISGSIASILSTVFLSICGKRENGSCYAPTNATSHWLWGESAKHRNEPSARFTLVGYAIHHASSCLWGVVYEKWLGCNNRFTAKRHPMVSAGTIAALACFVDMQLTPPRLRPGFEKRLSKPSLALVYGAFGLALGVRGALARRQRTDLNQG